MNSTVTAIGKLVRRHRIDRNMTQLELARRIGLGASQMIYAIENGLARIPREKVARLCEAINIDPKRMMDLLLQEEQNKIEKSLRLGKYRAKRK